jgi:uncharacterized LabA/DUF88 family protein
MTTYIQIDLQNLFFSAKDIDKRVDFFEIMEHLKNKEENILNAVAYIIRSPNFNSEKFEHLLKTLGYTLNIKSAQISSKRDGSPLYRGTNQGMSICIDCMENLDKFDKWILMSGDGEFIELCKKIKSKGKFVEVWAIPGKSFNKNFSNHADTVNFLEGKFLYDSQTKKAPSEAPKQLKEY